MISASWQYIGELAVPVSTWMKSGPLTVRETDEARLHPYHGERALAVLGGEGKAVAALVLRHHERLDGSGYHRYVRGSDLSPAARILAAAEAFQTAREARPHRPQRSVIWLRPQSCASPSGRESSAPTLSKRSSRAPVSPARREMPERLAGGLTPREIEVLRLIAAGHTAKEAARHLEIAPKTADNHIQSLYSKIGVTTRAAAALYAVERGLVQQGFSAA
jgi:DNA-binding CsgD family transcriptional regulator